MSFQSWQPHPQFCLPESDSTTFTSVIDSYVSAMMTNNGVAGPTF